MFDNVSFSRLGLKKALMLVCWKEMLSARFHLMSDFCFFWPTFCGFLPDFGLVWTAFLQAGFGFQELQLSYFCGSNR